MRVLLLSAMLVGVAACSPGGVPGANIDLTPPSAFAERPPPAMPPTTATAQPAPAPEPAPVVAANEPGPPVPLTPPPNASPSAELSIPSRPGPPPSSSAVRAQLPAPPPEIASPPAPPEAVAAPSPPAPPPASVAIAVPPPAPPPPPAEAVAVPAPPAPPPPAEAAAAPPPSPGFVFGLPTWPFFVSNQPVPGQLPGPRLTLSNFSYDRAHVEATITSAADCGADTVSRVEFDLAYNGTRVIEPPAGDDVCWRRDTSMDTAGGPQWSRWNRAFLSAGQSVDSRL